MFLITISLLSAFDWELFEKETNQTGSNGNEKFKRIRFKKAPEKLIFDFANTDFIMNSVDSETFYFEIKYRENEEDDAVFSLEDGVFEAESKTGSRIAVKEIKAYLPTGTNLKIATISGDVLISGFQNNIIMVKTTSGDIDLNNISTNNEIRLETVSGEIQLSNIITGSLLDIESKSGEIRIKNSESNQLLSIKTISGDISLSESKITGARIKGISSGLIIENSSGSDINVQTVSGDVIQKNSSISNNYFKSSSGKWYIQE